MSYKTENQAGLRSLHTTKKNLARIVGGLAASLLFLGCGPGGATDGGGSTDGETGAVECSDAPIIGITDVSCSNGICEGRWDGTDAWSTVLDADVILAKPPVDPATVWDCEPAPQVDGCAVVDDLGHIGCFNIYDGWSVPVAACCAAGADWQAIGDGLAADAHGAPGDGDGDPGDGDGDGCGAESPVVECTDMNECWASAPSWTAEAKAATAQTIGEALEAGVLLNPANLDVGDECWSLIGSDAHACIVDVCGEWLFGQPADELPLEPSPSCDFVGVWESTWTAFDTCFGVIDGVAVELRSSAPAPGEMWGPCPISEQGTIDLCNSEDLACVPASDGTANICLPLGSCPDVVPLGLFGELGWGEACYPRCGNDSECMDGQVCAMADADGGSICAWPWDGWSDPGCAAAPFSLGCACSGMDCVEGLMCNGTGCTPCPDGSPGCPCGDGDYCETGSCVVSAANDWSMCEPASCLGEPCPGDYECIEAVCVWAF
jgi:hypothetical protein